MSRRSLVTAIVVVVLALMTISGLILATFMATGDRPGFGLGGRVALLEIDGVIASDGQFLEDVRNLRRDASVRAWVVAINSPGGVVAPSQSMFETLRRIRVEDNEPVIAVIGSVGASGGYYVALAADSILAMPGSITGSIGVIMEYPNVQELMDRVGVQMEVVKSGSQKDLGSPFRTMGPEDRAVLEALVTDVHAQFMEAVAEARRLPPEEVAVLADGRVLSGRQAAAAGLIDRMGNRQEAIDLAGRMAGLGSNPGIVRPPSEKGGWLLDVLLGQAAAATVRQAVLAVGRATVALGPAVKYVVH